MTWAAQTAHGYIWLLGFLFRLDWQLIHMRALIGVLIGYDVIKYTALPQLRRAWYCWRAAQWLP